MSPVKNRSYELSFGIGVALALFLLPGCSSTSSKRDLASMRLADPTDIDFKSLRTVVPARVSELSPTRTLKPQEVAQLIETHFKTFAPEISVESVKAKGDELELSISQGDLELDSLQGAPRCSLMEDTESSEEVALKLDGEFEERRDGDVVYITQAQSGSIARNFSDRTPASLKSGVVKALNLQFFARQGEQWRLMGFDLFDISDEGLAQASIKAKGEYNPYYSGKSVYCTN